GIADEVETDPQAVADGTRDWWQGTMLAETDGVPMTAGAVVVKVSTVDQVQAVLRLAGQHGLPVTVSAGRSNVTGAALPVRGGVVLDVVGLNRILGFNPVDQTVEVEAGVFGDVLEAHLQAEHSATVGHWPQSFAISTVGGWVACRGAGQLSTRYGKIEDIVVEMDVVLASGELVRVGGTSRHAVGPDLRHLFTGSEGALGVITRVVLRTWDLPDHGSAIAFAFDTFADGVEACRRVMQTGATPAVLRLYDQAEAQHHFGAESSLLLVADEGDPAIVDATIAVARRECAALGEERESEPILQRWLDTRYAIPRATTVNGDRHITADTMEVAGLWTQLPRLYDGVVAAVGAVPGTISVTAHVSHAYSDSAGIYFTLIGMTGFDDRAGWYQAAWDAANAVVLAQGAPLSHHHGIGVLRSPYLSDSLGAAMGVWRAVKTALDPNGILNPGKLGL
ncbi:MAG: FAD-binding oxidoreductase, partial [Propionibacteriaceae bacterium]|nr:FAD-binding oxidoreductase [Propionibacteriaceae bacterium]